MKNFNLITHVNDTMSMSMTFPLVFLRNTTINFLYGRSPLRYCGLLTLTGRFLSVENTATWQRLSI